MNDEPSSKKMRFDEYRQQLDFLLLKPISRDNMDEFFVSYDTYTTKPECEQRINNITNCEFVPNQMNEVLFDERLIWRCINSKRSVLISGKAGSGKSNLLKRFVSHLGVIPYALCAPTGIAAFNVGGETLHRKLSLGLAQDPCNTLFEMIKKNKVKYSRTWKFLLTTRILIIDEYSMVTPDLFNKLDYLFRKARNVSEPFGGVLLIMVGDLTQLGPVIKKEDGAARESERFVVDCDVFKLMKFCRLQLTRSYRQHEGDPYLDLLNEIRLGQLSEANETLLRSRIGVDISVTVDPSKGYHLEPIDLFSYKKQVELCNNSHMDELKKRNPTLKIHHFYPALDIERSESSTVMDEKDIETGRNMIRPPKDGKSAHPLEEVLPVFRLTVAEGAQVMMRCNKYADQGIVNGTMGIVTAVNEYISVLFMVKDKFMDVPVQVDRYKFTVRAGKTVDVVSVQYPLSLAWGSTIHKCQGLTLDRVRIDGRNCFDAGQLYTALSRVRKLADVSLIGFDNQSVIADKRAVQFETIQNIASS